MKTPLLALALLCLTGLGCHHKDATAEEPAAQIARDEIVFPANSRQLAALTVEAAQPSRPAALHFPGRLTWDENVTVRVFPEFSGRVVGIAAEVGQTVSRGDSLARIASPDYGQAQADAHKASGDFILAERTLRRTRELFLHGATAQKDVDSAEAEYGRAKAEKERAESRLALYGGAASSIDHMYELRSPLAGVVAERNLNPGQQVRPDQMLANAPQYFAPLFVVTDPSRLWIVLDVVEADVGRFQRGQTLQIKSPILPDRAFEGIVEWISDFVDPATRTFRVRGSVKNTQRLLKDETFVSVTLTGEATAGFDVPNSAVFLDGSKLFVYREDGLGRYQRREVRIGPEHDGRIPVIAGLQPGDHVVTHGCMLLEHLTQSAG
jgi:cobalt-zinc-cadmium efflux system membrane fusion protein